jgi:uncharacterized protein (TIGR02145 family)
MKLMVFAVLLQFLIFSCSHKDSSSNPPTITCMTNTAVTDVSGNVYTSVKIGTQEWLVENLKVTAYRDGTSIPNIASEVAWLALTNGGWCNYSNDVQYDNLYGKLYNWYAVSNPKGLAPAGWHIPTDAEWATLVNYLGGPATAGRKLKEIGMAHWLSDNNGTTTSTNSSCFTALPGGFRDGGANALFSNINQNGYWWSSSDAGAAGAGSFVLSHGTTQTNSGATSKLAGYSVRCVKD